VGFGICIGDWVKVLLLFVVPHLMADIAHPSNAKTINIPNHMAQFANGRRGRCGWGGCAIGNEG